MVLVYHVRSLSLSLRGSGVMLSPIQRTICSTMSTFISSPVTTDHKNDSTSYTRISPPLSSPHSSVSNTNTLYRYASSGSTEMMDIIINAVGQDRLGIVSDVSKIVIDCGGNVGESVAGRLGTYFSLMMLVTIPKSQYQLVQEQILHVPKIDAAVFDTKMTLSAAEKQKHKTPMIGYSGIFRLSGADHPGIVHKVTSALAKNSLNIDSLHTEQELAPYGGAVLFKMNGTVVATAPLAKHFDIHKIKQELHELGDTLNCEISLEDSSDEQYQGSFYGG